MDEVNGGDSTLKSWHLTFYGTEITDTQCGAAEYQDAYGRCLSCDNQCKSCTGPGPSACSACKNYSLDGSCVLTCPDGFFADDAFACHACSTGCKTCSSATVCLTCYNHLFQGLCLPKCPDDTFDDSGICRSCDDQCASGCTGAGPDHCLDCKNLKVALVTLNGFNCIAACNISYVYDATALACVCPTATYEALGNICQHCNPECVTCAGPEASHCTGKCRHAQFGSNCVAECPSLSFSTTNVTCVSIIAH